MNPNRNEPAAAREEILIGRVTDHEASPEDWRELESLAAQDPTVWNRLAQAQRSHATLQRRVEDELTIAELVDAPLREPFTGRTLQARWTLYSGWAAAALVALAWAGALGMGVRPIGPVQPASAGLPAGLSADRLLGEYIDRGREQGRVVGELPMLMLETRPAEGEGRVEVIYVRQLVERAVVNTVYEVSRDELGEPTPVRLDVKDLLASDSL